MNLRDMNIPLTPRLKFDIAKLPVMHATLPIDLLTPVKIDAPVFPLLIVKPTMIATIHIEAQASRGSVTPLVPGASVDDVWADSGFRDSPFPFEPGNANATEFQNSAGYASYNFSIESKNRNSLRLFRKLRIAFFKSASLRDGGEFRKIIGIINAIPINL